MERQLKIDKCNLNNKETLTQATIASSSVSVVMRKSQTKQDLIKSHHGVFFSPVQSTLVKVIKNGHLITWPLLDENLVTKNLPPLLNTAKVNLQQERQHIQSTKPPPSPDEKVNTVKARI